MSDPEKKMYRWYKAYVPAAHQAHPGPDEKKKYYVWAQDSFEALEKLRVMRGWKRGGGRKNNFHVPTILPITEKESVELEMEIVTSKKITLTYAKQYGYYSDRRY